MSTKQTPRGFGPNNLSRLAASNSSIPQSSSVAEVYDAEDYQSMWADISQHTVGQSMTLDEDNEYEGISTGIF